MRITEGQLRRIIREELLDETYQGFVDRTDNIEYEHDFYDPTFEKDPEAKKLARDIKRVWNEEADHSFMDSIIKIHWMKGTGDSELHALRKIEKFLSMSRRNEISTTGYLPGTEISSSWGDFGVIVKGRVTFAANNMNIISSGLTNRIPDEVKQKYASSGVPKRPARFGVPHIVGDGRRHRKYDDYILDAGSFVPDAIAQRTKAGIMDPIRENEFIVDNWKPVAIIRSFNISHLREYDERVKRLIEIEKLIDSGDITKEQFEVIVMAKDIEDATRLAREGLEPEQIESTTARFKTSLPNIWRESTYEYMKPAFTFDRVRKGFQKLGLPIVDRFMRPVWTPK